MQQLSRSRTVVAAWNGRLEGSYLVYAQPDHPGYRCYSTGDLVIISLPGAAQE
ncbi:MAG TPA: BREX-3 system P-loop-containing protein BrxF [Tepidisphaeraceae bacterium]|nr:BREX-3 system P-loop-containing protein BrxF [Tepidisphaeraceae bacterium]